MKTLKIDTNLFDEDYYTVVQHHALLSDTQHMYGELGRGSGKSTHIMAPRIERVTYDMPSSVSLLLCATYTSLLDNIIPAITSYLNKHYIRGIHYEYGKQPPPHFLKPYREIPDWKRTLSFAWGSVVRFGSIDRPESILGSDFVHIFTDELLRIKETAFVERVIPTLRADRSLFGHSHYYRGITGTSSTPNFENDHDWWMAQEQNMNREMIEYIKSIALRVHHAEYYRETSQSEKEILKHERFINRWENRLRELRKDQTTYIKGSSFTNLAVLDIDYITNQYKGSISNLEKFNLSILGIRPKKVGEMFFGRFGKQHIFTDSYDYNNIDDIDKELHASKGSSIIADGHVKTSFDLKYCDRDRPIIAGFDPGHFMSIVFAQEHTKYGKAELRVFKNMYVTHPEQHFELAQNIALFFKNHRRKKIFLYYDRAANQHKRLYENNQSGKTDARILQKHLKDLGWEVELKDLGRETIYHYLHYIMLNVLFGERQNNTPRIKICQNECEELISSIYMSPLKRKDGQIFLDKSSEDKLSLEDQAFWSTQIATSLMYMLYGLYQKFMPGNTIDYTHYSGL